MAIAEEILTFQAFGTPYIGYARRGRGRGGGGGVMEGPWVGVGSTP